MYWSEFHSVELKPPPRPIRLVLQTLTRDSSAPTCLWESCRTCCPRWSCRTCCPRWSCRTAVVGEAAGPLVKLQDLLSSVKLSPRWSWRISPGRSPGRSLDAVPLFADNTALLWTQQQPTGRPVWRAQIQDLQCKYDTVAAAQNKRWLTTQVRCKQDVLFISRKQNRR